VSRSPRSWIREPPIPNAYRPGRSPRYRGNTRTSSYSQGPRPSLDALMADKTAEAR